LKKGKIIYAPSLLILEIEDIKREDKLDKNAEAIYELLKYARAGRETKRFWNMDLREVAPLPKLPSGRVYKKVKNRDVF